MRSSAQHAGLQGTYINTTIPLTQEGNFGLIAGNAAAEDRRGLRADAQGTWAYDPFVPTALNTPATQAYVAALKKYEGYTSSPDLDLDFGWAMASAFITGLTAAGRNPTRASYIKALRAVNNFTDDGLAKPGELHRQLRHRSRRAETRPAGLRLLRPVQGRRVRLADQAGLRRPRPQLRRPPQLAGSRAPRTKRSGAPACVYAPALSTPVRTGALLSK
jgi:hypothetical protein